MSVDALRDAVKGLMPQAKSDLTEMVSCKSVHDAAQFPVSECDRMVDWLVTRSPRSACRTSPRTSTARRQQGRPRRTRPAPTGAPTVLLYCHYDVQPPLGDDAWTLRRLASSPSATAAGTAAARPTARATSSCTSPRCVRCAGQRRACRSPSRSSARARRSRAPAAGGLRAEQRRPAARRRDPGLRHAATSRSACRRSRPRCAAWPTSSSPWRRWPARCTPACSAAPRRTRWPR